MFGPERARPCPMCTSFVGSLDIPTPDIEQRLAIAIVGRSPVARQLAFARERGWRNLKFYQTIGDDFARDYGALTDGKDGWTKAPRSWSGSATATRSACSGRPRAAPRPPIPASTRISRPIRRRFGPSSTGRPKGRGTDWYPKLDYSEK